MRKREPRSECTKKRVTKVVALAMSLVLAFSMVSTTTLTAFADELAVATVALTPQKAATTTRIGDCNWAFDESTGILTITPAISGTAQLTFLDFDNYSFSADKVETIVLNGKFEILNDEFMPFASFKNMKSIRSESGTYVQLHKGYYLFAGCGLLSDISGLASWDASSMTDMSQMFQNCSSLANISVLANWDISSVTNMEGSFSGCSSLTNLSGLASWNTAYITNMQSLFASCISLSDISGLSRWNTSNVTDMSSMFYYCKSLSGISGLANWNTSSLETTAWMFEGCTSLSSTKYLAKWNTSSLFSTRQMFSDCISLSDISGLAKWDTSGITDSYAMFWDCTALTDIRPLTNWNTSAVAYMDYMFYNCRSLSDISALGKWNMSSANGSWVNATTGIGGIFEGSPITKITLGPKWKITDDCGLWTPFGGKLTGKWVSKDAKVKGPFTTQQLISNWNPTTMAGTWIAQELNEPINLSAAKLSGLVSKAYTGKAIKQVPSVKLGSLTLKSGRDFTVSYKNNKKVGKATVTVKGKGNFAGTKSATFKIVKYKQPMTAKAAKKTQTAKASTLKKKSVTLAKPITVKKAKGKVTYANASTAKAAKAFKISAKTGKVTIPKGTKKGTYTMKAKVIAAGAGQYAYGTKTVSFKVKVK